jgi:hypothetical protein
VTAAGCRDLCCPRAQVVLLSEGHTLYSGPRGGLLRWCTSPAPDGLGLDAYDPLAHGALPDWVLDVSNTTFRKPEVDGWPAGLERLPA